MDTTTPPLHVYLFGDFRVLYRGEPLTTLHQARLQSLLAYLILHRGAPQARQRVAFLFWPDSNEKQAQGNLRRSLHLLRSALPEGDVFLYADASVVQWQPTAPFMLDVALFEQWLTQAEHATEKTTAVSALAKAVELYTGDLMPGCYDDWIAPVRERLREEFLVALAQLGDLWEQARDYPAAIRQATRLLHCEPLQEETYRRLMRLHLLNCDRTAALRTYHTCVATLQRELGVEPSPPTQTAYRQLLHLDTPPGPPRAERGKRDLLIGRQLEWQRLMQDWQRTADGHAHFVCVSGDPGIGKTRLLEEFAQWASQQGFATARTRAYAAEGNLAYDPIAEWLRSEALSRRIAKLEDAWRLEVARLVPELWAERADFTSPQPLTESWQRRQFFEALARAFLALPEPLLLVLDDLQWCDRETLEWLHYLLRRDPHSRLLIVGSARPGEIDREHPLYNLLRQLRQTEQVTEFELAPLAGRETAQLAHHVAGQALNAEQLAEIQRVTEGNPLLIHEIVWSAAEPPASDATAQRLAWSQPPCQRKCRR